MVPPPTHALLSNGDPRSAMVYLNMMASAAVPQSHSGQAAFVKLHIGSFVGTHVETHNVDNRTQSNDNKKNDIAPMAALMHPVRLCSEVLRR